MVPTVACRQIKSIHIAHRSFCLPTQLIDAAKSGSASEVDRLIRTGVSKEGKNAVRVCDSGTLCFAVVVVFGVRLQARFNYSGCYHGLKWIRLRLFCVAHVCLYLPNYYFVRRCNAIYIRAGRMDGADFRLGQWSRRVLAAAHRGRRRQECAHQCACL